MRLQQILWNLIRNAIKFTPASGSIIIRTRNEADRLVISVADTGIGIDSDAISRIFTPFEQANRAITQQFGGLGLGLAISKRLAELQGGSLTAHSDGPNCGATFSLVLPVIAHQEVYSLLQPSPALAEEGASLRILLVEDHEDTRISLARLLARRHVVRDVESIASALEAARKDPFDLVISDLGLPDGTGYELMRELRQRHQLKGICLSGFGMEDDITRATEAGFDRHLTKPVDLRTLERAIQSLAP